VATDVSFLGLAGKAALVVGGGQGMGESTSRLLARAGCDVAVLDIERDRAEAVASAVRDAGQRGVPLIADVLDDPQLLGAVREAEAALDGLDILVTIVGQGMRAPLLEMPVADWDLDQRRNVRYFFLAARELARSLIRRGRPGAIACIASVSGLQSGPNHAAYGAAKAGLINLVRSMAVEWAPYNIRVNALAPGGVVTPRYPDTPEMRDWDPHGLVPMQRRATCDEIGKVVLFLVSDLASYVTGQTLAVDGGWMAAFLMGMLAPTSRPASETSLDLSS
jgi:NAD(P)-dependent dehydrogenase (short-subunit alcohol dehydrogenase family)